jgi:hypothetical protein
VKLGECGAQCKNPGPGGGGGRGGVPSLFQLHSRLIAGKRERGSKDGTEGFAGEYYLFLFIGLFKGSRIKEPVPKGSRGRMEPVKREQEYNGTFPRGAGVEWNR